MAGIMGSSELSSSSEAAVAAEAARSSDTSLPCGSRFNGKQMTMPQAIAEQIADLFGETKYSISFFVAGQKINLNDKLADLNIGYYKNPKHQ